MTFSPAIKFSEKDIRKTVKVTWDDENINSLGEGNYAVAIELSVDNNALEVPEARKVMIVSMAWSHLGMEADVAPVFSPAASRETAVYEGPVTIDNPISVMDITVDYEIDNSLITAYNDANGTDYKAAPADLVSLAATSSQLEAGKSSTAFSLQILSEKFVQRQRNSRRSTIISISYPYASSRCRTRPSASAAPSCTCPYLSTEM